MDKAQKQHLDQFKQNLIRIGDRIGIFLNYECIHKGIDVNNPNTTAQLSISAYDLMFLVEVINSHLISMDLKQLGWELQPNWGDLSPKKSNNTAP